MSINYEIDYVIKGKEFVKAETPLEAEEKTKDMVLETYEGFADIQREDIDIVNVMDVANYARKN